MQGLAVAVVADMRVVAIDDEDGLALAPRHQNSGALARLGLRRRGREVAPREAIVTHQRNHATGRVEAVSSREEAYNSDAFPSLERR